MPIRVFIQLFYGCSDSIKDKLNTPGFSGQIVELDIYNKTRASFNSQELKITDKEKIGKICHEIKNLQKADGVSVKANFGYYQLELRTIKNELYSLDVIYTTYNGVIIQMNNDTYKNDSLESLILYYFQ